MRLRFTLIHGFERSWYCVEELTQLCDMDKSSKNAISCVDGSTYLCSIWWKYQPGLIGGCNQVFFEMSYITMNPGERCVDQKE